MQVSKCNLQLIVKISHRPSLTVLLFATIGDPA